MDKIDIAILEELQADGRASSQQLSDRVGLSPAPVWRRVKALEAEGVITGYGAHVERNRVGLNSCMFAQISLERHSTDVVENFERSVRDAPEILECYAVTGDSDFLLKILVESAEDYDRFLHRFLFNLPGIRQTRTIVALREIKHETRLPLARLRARAASVLPQASDSPGDLRDRTPARRYQDVAQMQKAVSGD